MIDVIFYVTNVVSNLRNNPDIMHLALLDVLDKGNAKCNKPPTLYIPSRWDKT